MGHTAHLRGTPPKLNPPTFYCPPVFREISLLFTCDISIRANINKQKDKSYAYVIVHFHFTQILMLPFTVYAYVSLVKTKLNFAVSTTTHQEPINIDGLLYSLNRERNWPDLSYQRVSK